MAPTPSSRMSPSRMRRWAGIPGTTSSLSDVQMEAGTPRYPLNDGVAPSDRMKRSANSSSWAVVMPGFTASSSRSIVCAVMTPARRISLISSGDLYSIMAPSSGERSRGHHPLERLHGPLGHLVGQGVGVDLSQHAPLCVPREQRLRLVVVHLETVAHRLLSVVFPLGQPAPTAVAYVLLAWRRQLDVVGTLADGAAAASRDSLHGQLIVHGQEQSRRDGE